MKHHASGARLGQKSLLILGAAIALYAGQAASAGWSDTLLGYRYGTRYREPPIR